MGLVNLSIVDSRGCTPACMCVFAGKVSFAGIVIRSSVSLHTGMSYGGISCVGRIMVLHMVLLVSHMEPFNETLCTLVARAGQDHGVAHGVVTGDCSGTQCDTWSLAMKHWQPC